MTTTTMPGQDDPGEHAHDTLWAGLTLRLDTIGQQLQEDARRRRDDRPTRGSLYRGGIVPAGGRLVLDLGVPAMGHRWDLRNVSVSNAGDVRTAAAGTADIYVGNPGAYSPAAWRWGLPALPGAEGFSADRISVIPTDHLFVVVEGGTAGDQLLARADVADYPNQIGRPVIPV